MFITFEGPEGSGKSTNARWLARWIEGKGRVVVQAREPGGTALGERIRPLLLHGDVSPTPQAALLLFAAARAELVHTVLRPALDAGSVVVCDRFTDSTLAYQGYGDGLELEEVQLVNGLATQGLRPDLTILLDVNVEEGLRRRARGTDWNAMDARSLEFHRRVRAGFLALAAEEPDRWLVLDAAGPLDIIRTAIVARLVEESAWGRTQ